MTLIVEEHRLAPDVMQEHTDRLSNRQLGKLRRAGHTTERVFKDRKRKTGDPAVTHAYGTDQILVVLGFALDITMRIVALLHDTLEDCDLEECYTLRRKIRRFFGPIVYMMVEALTRKDGIDYPAQLLQAIRRWYWLGLWRLIFVKLADLLFNMSTIGSFGEFAWEMHQYDKANQILSQVAIPARQYVPAKHHGKFDELLTSVSTLLETKRQETIVREQAQD